jgi:hypothetical protein
VLQECYTCLSDKTLAFLLTVHHKFDVKWVMKIDDDVFLAPERLPHIIPQWDAVGADYVGCMKTGGVHGNADDKWYVSTLVATTISKCTCMHACKKASGRLLSAVCTQDQDLHETTFESLWGFIIRC